MLFVILMHNEDSLYWYLYITISLSLQIYLVPKSLARKRIWNKKYPICIELGQQDDFMSKAQTDKETCEEKPAAERELANEDPKKPLQPPEGTRAGQRDQILYLFGRTGREKEEWFRRFVLASKLKSELKKPLAVSGSKSGNDICVKCLVCRGKGERLLGEGKQEHLTCLLCHPSVFSWLLYPLCWSLQPFYTTWGPSWSPWLRAMQRFAFTLAGHGAYCGSKQQLLFPSRCGTY